MSKKPKAVMIGRIIIRTPEDQAVESARILKSEFARLRAMHKAQAKKKPSTNYDPSMDVNSAAARPGADDALSIPSRHGDRLHYRDGRVIDIFTGASV
jgi:hypothetical protein